jgi:quercetin dioxygenase-like cupin family protein
MRKSTLGAAVLLGVLAVLLTTVFSYGDASDKQGGPQLETLLKEVLEGVDSTEVIVSRVTIPPNTSLPKHWHPGEEFAYVLDGSLTLWQDGKDDIIGKAGDAVKVPLKQVHTAITGDEGATVLVFRVHQEGKAERVLVEEK